MQSYKLKALILATLSALSLINKPMASLALPSISILMAQAEIEEPELETPAPVEEEELMEDPQGQPNPFLDP